MLTGVVQLVSPDASANEGRRANDAGKDTADSTLPAASVAPYKARIKLDRQTLAGPEGEVLHPSAGMQAMVEIHQGRRTILEYLLSPVQKVVAEAGHER